LFGGLRVFIYHNRKYWRGNLHPELLRLINEFHIGVALFFVLSGFLIAYTYADKPMQSGKGYARYILLRLARIMPLYWLILTAYYLDPAFGKNQFSPLTYSLFHGFSDNYNLNGIAQAWSLTVEMTFYFFAPLLCLLQRKHILYLIGSLLLLFGITWGGGILWHRINGNPGHYFYPSKFIFEATFAGRSTEFLAGMLLAYVMRNQKISVLKKIRFKTFIGFSGIFITCYCAGLFQPDIYHSGTEHIAGRLMSMFIQPFFIMLSLAGLICERTWLQRFFSSRILVLLGNASFSFYLVHISYINIKIGKKFMLPDRNFIALWVVSILLYLLFEKPVYNFCRKILKRESPVASSASLNLKA
jgi:peptidoglycan/LPS O-acetylase OafA/YrhL